LVEVKEKGFMPFSLVGVVLVVMVLGMLGHSVWIKHERDVEVIEGEELSELGKLAAEVRGNLRTILRRATQKALVEVCKEAYRFGDEARKLEIERSAGRYFWEELKGLAEVYARHDNRTGLHLNDHHRSVVEISETENGYVRAKAVLPGGSYLALASWDNSVSVEMPLEEVETLIDSRYFLLERRMNDFVEGMGEINTLWGLMEYARAWGEAWLGGRVHLDESIDQALFQAAWAIHEYGSFGSCDYWGTALGLTDPMKDVLVSGTVAVSPIRASEVDDMKQFIEEAIDAADEADSMLGGFVEKLSLVREARAENLPAENIRKMLERRAEELAGIRSKVLEVKRKFEELVAHVSQLATDDAMMELVHGGLTTRSLSPDLPSPKEQLEWGVKGICQKLLELGDEIKLISETGMSSEELDELLEIAKNTVEGLRFQPGAVGWAKVTVYKDDPPEKVENYVPIYITESSGATLGALKEVLGGLREDLDELLELPEDLGGVGTGEIPGLDELLKEGLMARVPSLGFDREELYRIFPPPPLSLDPGISVFHEIEIKEITHTRHDLAGLCGVGGATPIPLPFLNIVLYWGQWETKIELGETVVEIFDFENPTILQPSELGYVHAPLAYRWELPGKTFTIEVVVISLRFFTIG
jgi:hypothetical protein